MTTTGTDVTMMTIVVIAVAGAIAAMIAIIVEMAKEAARDTTTGANEKKTNAGNATMTTGGGATKASALSMKAAPEEEAANRAVAGMIGMTTATGTGPAPTIGMMGLLRKGQARTTRT